MFVPLGNSQVVLGVFSSLRACFVSDSAAELQQGRERKGEENMLEVVATGSPGSQLAFAGIVKVYFASCCQLDALSEGDRFN